MDWHASPFRLRRDHLRFNRLHVLAPRRGVPARRTLLAALEDQLQLLELFRGVIRRAKARGGWVVFARAINGRGRRSTPSTST